MKQSFLVWQFRLFATICCFAMKSECCSPPINYGGGIMGGQLHAPAAPSSSIRMSPSTAARVFGEQTRNSGADGSPIQIEKANLMSGPVPEPLDLFCSDFDEKCRWRNMEGFLVDELDWYQGAGYLDEARLRLATNTHIPPEGYYGIAATDKIEFSNTKAILVSDVIECQLGTSELRFRYWTSPEVRIVVCTKSMLRLFPDYDYCAHPVENGDPGPAFVSLPDLNGQSFQIYLRAENFVFHTQNLQGGFAIVDDIEYLGDFCQTTSTTAENQQFLAASKQMLPGISALPNIFLNNHDNAIGNMEQNVESLLPNTATEQPNVENLFMTTASVAAPPAISPLRFNTQMNKVADINEIPSVPNHLLPSIPQQQPQIEPMISSEPHQNNVEWPPQAALRIGQQMAQLFTAATQQQQHPFPISNENPQYIQQEILQQQQKQLMHQQQMQQQQQQQNNQLREQQIRQQQHILHQQRQQHQQQQHSQLFSAENLRYTPQQQQRQMLNELNNNDNIASLIEKERQRQIMLHVNQNQQQQQQQQHQWEREMLEQQRQKQQQQQEEHILLLAAENRRHLDPITRSIGDLPNFGSQIAANVFNQPQQQPNHPQLYFAQRRQYPQPGIGSRTSAAATDAHNKNVNNHNENQQVCDALSCSFDDHCAEYVLQSSSQWQISGRPAGNPLTGIRGDASKTPFNKEGTFAFVVGPKDKARFATPPFHVHNDVYLMFAYHKVSRSADLRVLVRKANAANDEVLFEIAFEVENMPANSYIGIDEMVPLDAVTQQPICQRIARQNSERTDEISAAQMAATQAAIAAATATNDEDKLYTDTVEDSNNANTVDYEIDNFLVTTTIFPL